MSRPKALLFDLNGTMVDDMQYHIQAWHRILNELGAGISMEQTKLECYGKNEELLERIFPGRFSQDEKCQVSIEKEKIYQSQFKPYLSLLPGLTEFLQACSDKKISMAIGSAAMMFNIDFVIDNLGIRPYFEAIVSADDIKTSKPDPETYLTCAAQLKVSPYDCIVFEDSPKGVESATAAGMKSVVLTTLHRPDELEYDDNIIMFIKDYTDERLNGLIG